jgi:hypothetical protein
MDFIQANIERKVRLLQSLNKNEELKVLYQARFEYALIFTLAYLWNKNFDKIDSSDKEFINKSIITPSIGSIVKLCRMLDVENKFFKEKKFAHSLEVYPNLRNEKIGHGYSFEDDTENILNTLGELYSAIRDSNVSLLSKNVDLILVLSEDNNVFSGIRFHSNGSDYLPWSCHKNIYPFIINNLYGATEINDYFRLSPFIILKDEIEFYLFSSIQEKLLGNVKYNRLLKSGKYFQNWEELVYLDIERDSTKRKSSNGTIINIFENNFNKYIDIGIKSKINDFLTKNNSSVCATIWGHGGVGKTATVQSICEDLANGEYRKFNYIVFLSAKDRRYNFYTGEIEEVVDNISSLSDLLKTLNFILFGENSDSEEKIIKFEGKICIVIDDFETFSQEEKDKISNFIINLNINHHKVIITTRANIIIGQEIPTNELNALETKKFLLAVIQNEIPNIFQEILIELDDPTKIKLIHEVTTGRPLFIFQLAFIIGQKGNIDEALKYDIKDSESAKNFLYGRLYEDYLSKIAQDVFVTISLLVTSDDLSNLIDKIKYVLNLEHEEDEFNAALKGLVRLKVIKVDDDNRFFEVYSKEILQIMTNYYQKKNDTFKRGCISRLNQINTNKSLDNEQALLSNAKASQLSKNEEEVIGNYRQIINRTTCPEDIKVQAILGLSAYLIDRGNKNKALDLLNEYRHNFEHNSFFNKMHATYYWGNGTDEQKQKAIKILLDFSSKDIDFNKDIDVEIAGQLLTYRCIMLINDWLELNTQNRYKEITYEAYRVEREKQIQVCKDIYNKQGVKLFAHISHYKLLDMQSGVRQNIVAGLYQFLDICLRIQKFEKGIEICDYMSYFAPRSFHPQFQRKREKFDAILYNETGQRSKYSRPNKNETKNYKNEGDISLQLKDIFNKK